MRGRLLSVVLLKAGGIIYMENKNILNMFSRSFFKSHLSILYAVLWKLINFPFNQDNELVF